MTVSETLVEFKVTATFERLKFCFFTIVLIFIKLSDIDTIINIMHIVSLLYLIQIGNYSRKTINLLPALI